MNEWQLKDELKEKYIPILKEYFAKLESLTDEEVICMENDEFVLDLYNTGLAPYTLQTLLEKEFGYKAINIDDNGWELDLWITLEREDNKYFPSTCERMTIAACGQTFALKLHPTEIF